MKGTVMSPQLRNLCERFDWTCALCGGKVPDERPFDDRSPKCPTRDHIIPRQVIRQNRKRFSNRTLEEGNIRLTHRYCNNKRAQKKQVFPEMFVSLESLYSNYIKGKGNRVKKEKLLGWHYKVTK